MQHQLTTNIVKSILCIFVFSTIFSSCIKDDFEFDKIATTQWNPSLAIPLVNSSLVLEDFIPEDDNLIINSNNELVLIYESIYESPLASEIYPISNQNFNQSIDFPGLPIGTPVDSGSVTIDTTIVLDFNAPLGMEIDSILFNTGQWNFNFTSSFRQSGTLQIIIRDAEFNNAPLISTIPINYTGTIPVSTSASFNISNYLFDLSRHGSAFNELEVQYILTLINNGNTYSPGDNISISNSINSIKFKEIHGYFGEQVITTNADTIDLSVFRNEFQYSSLTLSDPSLDIDINNSFGMPIEAQLNQFSTYDSQVGFINISGPGLPNPIFIPGPAVSQMGQSILTNIHLDNTNSNISTALNSQPDAFLYNSDGFTNPSGRVDKNFILEDSRMTVNSTFELPLHGSFDRLVVSDTMDFALDAIDEIESITLISNMVNGFPMDFEIQLFFIDENNLVLDSLADQKLLIVDSAPVNPTSGLVTGTKKKHNTVIIPQEKIQNVSNSSKVVLRSSSSTFSNGSVPVKLKSDYTLDIKIGALLTLKTEF